MSVPWRIVVMGVAGSGKTTVGRALAERHHAHFIEADAFHPGANLAKMAAGVPLSDADRRPWLAALRRSMAGEDRAVLACSALRHAYRDELRSVGHVRFIHLVVGPGTARARVTARARHVFPPSLVDSQFEVLEVPGSEEKDVARIDERAGIATVLEEIDAALVRLRARRAPGRG